MHPSVRNQVVLRSGVPGWVDPGAIFDADFANSRWWPRAVEDEFVDTRASDQYVTTAGGVLIKKAATVLPYADSGLCVEPAATNLLLRSQELGTTWSPSAGSVTSDVTTAPDSTMTADLFSEDATTASRFVSNSNSLTAQTYVFSAYLKYAGRQWVRLGAASATTFSGGAWFDLQNGVLGTTSATLGTAVSGAIMPVAQGFYRCCLVFISAGNAVTGMRVQSSVSDGSTTAVPGLNGPGFYLWQADLVAASQLTSPIATAGTTASRAANAITLQRTGVGRVVYTFDDASQQTVSGINTAAQYAIATNLNRRLIKRMTGFAS